jgi:RHS repeat-associated protein
MNDGTRQKFTGYERDWETGLDYANARYDASAQGRFLSVDPLLSSADVASPQSFNRYSYVENNPLNLTDPSGLMPYDASHSFADVSDHFWGGGMDFSRPPASRGRIIIAAAMCVHDGSIAANVNEMRLADISRKARPLTGFRLPLPPNPFSQFTKNNDSDSEELAELALVAKLPHPFLNRKYDECGDPKKWRQRLADYRAIGSYIEFTFDDEGNPDAHHFVKPSDVVFGLKRHGFAWFLDMDPRHFGYEDYEGQVNGRWYHVSVRKSDAGGFGTNGFWAIHDNRLPNITIHCDRFYYRPSGWHRLDVGSWF